MHFFDPVEASVLATRKVFLVKAVTCFGCESITAAGFYIVRAGWHIETAKGKCSAAVDALHLFVSILLILDVIENGKNYS